MSHPASPPPDPASAPHESLTEAGGANRRAFLAGAGAATVIGAAAVVLPAGAAAAAEHDVPATAAGSGPAAGDAVVAYLRDPARAEVRLLSGEHEVVVHDPELARALTRHARTATQER